MRNINLDLTPEDRSQNRIFLLNDHGYTISCSNPFGIRTNNNNSQNELSSNNNNSNNSLNINSNGTRRE